MLLFLVNIVNALFLEVDYNTVYQMAVMSRNTYCGIYDNKWINTTLDQVMNVSISNTDVNAYLFTNNEKTIGVVAFKGTSVSLFGLNSDFDDYLLLENDLESSKSDKYNDNLFFSCCFYKQSKMFNSCDLCENNANNQLYMNSELLNKTCCKDCYSGTLDYSLNYINIVKKIIENVMTIIDFEKSKIIFTGHSLGGVLASVSSIMYDKQAITFETPGDKHYLNLLNMKASTNIYHFGHNADPIFNGNCGSTCSSFGYNINTKCHSGYTCLYDAKGELGYTESILNHRIEYIINNVIPKWGYKLPDCKIDNECKDCEEWVFT